MSVSLFYYNINPATDGDSWIRGLGVHERMKPGVIRHGGQDYPYLFMFFHNLAFLNPGKAEAQAAASAMMIWEPGLLHDYGNPEMEWDHSWLIVHSPVLPEILKRHSLPLNRLLFFKSEDIFVRYLEMLYRELNMRDEQDSYMQQHILSLMVHELGRVFNRHCEYIPSNIMKAAAFIKNNYAASIDLADMAHEASLSVPRFTVLFKKYYGDTPVHFLIRTRLERSALLLRYKNLSIKQIAQETGFNDQLYFSRQFNAYYGQSPRDFREKS